MGAVVCSETVSGRRPFGKDLEMDYSVDSGDEWEVGEAKGWPEERQIMQQNQTLASEDNQSLLYVVEEGMGGTGWEGWDGRDGRG